MPSSDRIAVMQRDIGIIKERTRDICRFIDGNGREGARDRLTRVEATLERSADLSESNARSISMLQGMIGDIEKLSTGCVKEALKKHEEGPKHNLKFQVLLLTVKDPKFVLIALVMILLVIDLVSHGTIKLPLITSTP